MDGAPSASARHEQRQSGPDLRAAERCAAALLRMAVAGPRLRRTTPSSVRSTCRLPACRCSSAKMVEVREWTGRGDDWQIRGRRVAEEDLRFEIDPHDPTVTTAVWVRWQAQPHFYRSTAADRHYVVERATGVFRFPGAARFHTAGRMSDRRQLRHRRRDRRQRARSTRSASCAAASASSSRSPIRSPPRAAPPPSSLRATRDRSAQSCATAIARSRSRTTSGSRARFVGGRACARVAARGTGRPRQPRLRRRRDRAAFDGPEPGALAATRRYGAAIPDAPRARGDRRRRARRRAEIRRRRRARRACGPLSADEAGDRRGPRAQRPHALPASGERGTSMAGGWAFRPRRLSVRRGSACLRHRRRCRGASRCSCWSARCVYGDAVADRTAISSSAPANCS